MTPEEQLNNLYYKEKNFDSYKQLYKKAKARGYDVTIKFVKDWLAKQSTSALVNDKKPGVKNKYLPIYSEVPYAFQIDLTFFPRYVDENKGYGVLFTAININTRFVYAYKAKDKKMETITNIIKKMEEETVINSLTCDEGSEFNNKEFLKFCEDNEIRINFIKNDSHKLGIINRFHRTLKNKLTKYFIAHNTVKWYKVYKDIVNNYNNSVNRGIGIEPIKVNDFIENEIVKEKKAQTGIIKPSLPEFMVGDSVILKRKVTTFDDKMKSAYHSKVYRVIGLTANSLKLIDKQDNHKKVKKSQAKKINPDTFDVDNEPETAIEKANKKHKQKQSIKRLGVDIDNIIEGKRERKPVQRYA